MLIWPKKQNIIYKNLLYIKMGKEISMFRDIEIEKKLSPKKSHVESISI